MLKITVPATSANLGPGFDCIGLALKMYNTTVFEPSPGPFADGGNLILQSFRQFYKMHDMAIPGVEIKQDDNIPMTRGLGSSAACIVAGLMAANEMSRTGLTRFELAQLAAGIEGHPDNAAPAILGGMVAAVLDVDGTMKYVKTNIPDEMAFAAIIPAFELPTERARAALPVTISPRDGVFNASRAALLMASVMSGNWDNLATATADRFHQPYRKPLVPNMGEIICESLRRNAKGAFLSGAGPTILSFVLKSDASSFISEMEKFLSGLPGGWKIRLLEADNEGALAEWL